MDRVTANSYLRKHTEVLVKDLGIEDASVLTGKSKTTIGRYYSDDTNYGERFMGIDTVVALETHASFPHVTAALADLRGMSVRLERTLRSDYHGGVNGDIIVLIQRFAMLMAEYRLALADGRLSASDARHMMRETLELQRILIEMRLELEECIADKSAS